MEKFIEKYRMEKDGRQILPPNWLRRKPASRRTSGGVHTKRAIDGGALSLIMSDAAARLEVYFGVTNSKTWGAHDPFDQVDGGKDGLIRALADVTSNVTDIPIDNSPFGSFLIGQLAGHADLSPSTIATIALFVSVEKDSDHVKM